MSKRHMLGAIKMVELNGGSQTLGLNGVLEHLFHKFVSDIKLLDQNIRHCDSEVVTFHEN